MWRLQIFRDVGKVTDVRRVGRRLFGFPFDIHVDQECQKVARRDVTLYL